MSDVCKWHKDKEIGRYFVPGCMGGAVRGEAGCTCDKRVNSLAEAWKKIDELAERVTELENESMKQLVEKF